MVIIFLLLGWLNVLTFDLELIELIRNIPTNFPIELHGPAANKLNQWVAANLCGHCFDAFNTTTTGSKPQPATHHSLNNPKATSEG